MSKEKQREKISCRNLGRNWSHLGIVCGFQPFLTIFDRFRVAQRSGDFERGVASVNTGGELKLKVFVVLFDVFLRFFCLLLFA